ncbi:UNVERIFIED_CONTAM: hypothetical protein HDU68_005984, partial [Siphonaria sp. JEL0065]
RNLLTALFKAYGDASDIEHKFADLLTLMRALVDSKDPHSSRIYCPGRELKHLMKYMWEGTDQQVPRNFELRATHGRMSELDVAHTYNLWKILKGGLFDV